jgi:carboxymethylenebutenolidase
MFSEQAKNALLWTHHASPGFRTISCIFPGIKEKSDNFPEHPLELAAQTRAPVLGLYGGQDTGIPVTDVEKMKLALAGPNATAAAKASKFEIYPDAPHAFHADYRQTYQEGPAKDGWQKALAWFKEKGV